MDPLAVPQITLGDSRTSDELAPVSAGDSYSPFAQSSNEMENSSGKLDSCVPVCVLSDVCILDRINSPPPESVSSLDIINRGFADGRGPPPENTVLSSIVNAGATCLSSKHICEAFCPFNPRENAVISKDARISQELSSTLTAR